ncbi:MAG: DUF881 domain-containing protein [Eubacteriales bacterium]|jgi:uncharacterized protein YlxW (UPF0749 family)|nr:DUF881 domain-containing protein [Eubacteriales bacterium]MDD4327462.1 DUF881 domain-containing protein [Eubacteriales bacterium]MDD4717655.1 DUF881 domain-containing protein [Eubacteriales bacterium]NCU25939.1 DUF881 domain-containing protein [Candidatus Nomurabacteria bacterium]
MKRSRNLLGSISLLIVCVVLGVLVSLQLKSVNSAQNLQLNANKRLEEIQNELIQQTRINRDLADRYAELKNYVETVENQTFEADDAFQRIMEEKRNAEIFAGLTEVSGSGVVITILAGTDFFVRDSDLRSVVNELRAAGAQAISVNEERMVATSEIREAGPYIVINGKQFPSNAQFEIKGIARAEDLERAMLMVSGIGEQLELYNIEFEIVKSEKVTIPRLREDSPAYRYDMIK